MWARLFPIYQISKALQKELHCLPEVTLQFSGPAKVAAALI